MSWTQFGIIFRYELTTLLRSRHGWLTLFSFLCLYAALAIILPWAHEGVSAFFDGLGQAAEQGSSRLAVVMDAKGEQLLPAPTAALKPTLSQVRTTIGAEPAVLLSLFLGVLWATPALAMLTAYDQLASDLWTRHARFLLVRTNRSTLLAGKLAACWAFFALALGLATGLGAALLPWDEHGLEGVGGLLYLGRIWATISLYALPYIAFLALTAVLFGKPIAALAAGGATLVGMFMVSDVLSGPGDIGVLLGAAGWLWPSAMKYHLMLHSAPWVFTAIGHLIGLTLAYALAAFWCLQRRDV